VDKARNVYEHVTSCSKICANNRKLQPWYDQL